MLSRRSVVCHADCIFVPSVHVGAKVKGVVSGGQELSVRLGRNPSSVIV
jgi:hypothetical protein